LIKGQTIEISLQPILATDLDETERSVPVQIDMRNVRYTDSGNVKKRNGYSEKWDIGAEENIKALIPVGLGYAISGKGIVYQLDAIPSQVTTLSTIQNTPRWVDYNSGTYVVYGSIPVRLNGINATLIGDMPAGRFIVKAGDRTVVAGHEDTRFDWSASNEPEDWDIASGAGFANVQKTGTIKNMIEYRNNLFFFKEEETEVYSYTGTSIPFRLQAGLNIDKGLGAVDSVVKANDRFYWFGNDGDFYEYSGGVPVVISDSIRARLDAMNNTSDIIGFDIRKENVIMWISQTDGVSLLYDYAKGKWLEDNRWITGWQALPFISYMELNRKQYFGSVGCDGKIHEWSSEHKDDDGSPLKVHRRLKAQISQRGHKVRVDRIRLRRKGAVATSSEASPSFGIRWRFDKGKWSIYQDVTMGAVGEHDPYVDIRRLGRGIELELEINESDVTDFLLTDMLVTYQELAA
jgi:hypothetical protein